MLFASSSPGDCVRFAETGTSSLMFTTCIMGNQRTNLQSKKRGCVVSDLQSDRDSRCRRSKEVTRNLPIARPLGLPVHPTASRHVVFLLCQPNRPVQER